MMNNKKIISGNTIAKSWPEYYPIGNGRIGAMVSGDPLCDRLALNHDRLWRRYWEYADKNIHKLFSEYQKLCLAKKWDDAYELIRKKLIIQGEGIYVNPFVPVGDLGIKAYHFRIDDISEYRRELDLEKGFVNVSYKLGDDFHFTRQYLCSYKHEVLAVNYQANYAGRVSGEAFMYRLPDYECDITGSANLGQIILQGEFEEGVKFTAVTRVIQEGGRLTRGLSDYKAPDAEPFEAELSGFQFGFRDFTHPQEPIGASVRFDTADEVTFLTSIVTDRQCDGDQVDFCCCRLDNAGSDFDKIKQEHIQDFSREFNRCLLQLGGVSDKNTSELITELRRTGKCDPALIENIFDMGRYLAISSGRIQKKDQVFKAPINLQGIWNEDPRPAWDCDYHLDLNIQMCYWGLGMVNLAEYGRAVIDWLFSLLDQAGHVSEDIYGVEGAFFTSVCDIENLANMDNLCFLASGTNAWIAQTAWQIWEYDTDEVVLRDKLYPVLKMIGLFFENFLVEDKRGRLITAPSGSPENCPVGRSFFGMLSVTSSFDLELIRDLFKNLITASKILKVDEKKRDVWQEIVGKLPLPTLNQEGRLLEWLEEDYRTVDPGHRHRSHFVGICPGTRITAEDTPDYNEGIGKALELRLSHGTKGSCSLDKASDAHIYARLYDASNAWEKICEQIRVHFLDNMLVDTFDHSEGGIAYFGDRKLFQIEANLGMMAAVTELFLQDRNGLIRLLPALPDKLPSGIIKGLLTRGGFEVDIEWENSRLTNAIIKAGKTGACKIKSYTTDSPLQIESGLQSIVIEPENGIVYFEMKADEIVKLTLR